jgi:phosphate transport system protein
MQHKHLSSQFDAELNAISTQVLAMGGLLEVQLRQAVQALLAMHRGDARQVLANEARLNGMEMSIDRQIVTTIGRRQPTARDLRFLIAISRTTQNLERAGDEIARIARLVDAFADDGALPQLPVPGLRAAADLAMGMLHKALDAFARLDTAMAVAIMKEDEAVDAEYAAFQRTLIGRMAADPGLVSLGLDLLIVARAIERVGDHAKNIAEQIIFIVMGEDVRHSSLEQVEAVVR